MSHGRVIAVIDVGSNSVRLLVGRELNATAFEVIDEERFDARLGYGQSANGDLTGDAIDRGARALRLVHEVALSHSPAVVVAAGTEALRRAPNASMLIERVQIECGICIRVLSAEEEAFASFLGVINSTSLTDGRILDIGGGSLELIEVNARNFGAVSSAPLGAIYAANHYLPSDPPARKDVRALRDAVSSEMRRNHSAQAPVLFGVGGALRNIARIARLRRRYPLRRLHGLTLQRREVARIARDLAAVSASDRRRIPGVSANRADILHASALVVDEVMEQSGAEDLVISGQGLREGLLWQAMRPEAPILPDVRAASISGLACANSVDEMAAEPTVLTAALLFDATRDVHGFGSEELSLLQDAARLARIGMHIDYYGRDRHAEYILRSGNLHGFSHRESVLLGFLVRAADGGTADLSPYRSLLQDGDARRMAILAGLLGLARAIRRRQPSPVLSVRAGVVGSTLDLQLGGSAPFDAEVIALERQQARFESALGLQLVVSVRR